MTARNKHTTWLGLLMLGAFLPLPAYGQDITVESALLTLMEHADLSMPLAGPLVLREIPEGTTVEVGMILGKVDSAEAEVNLQRARTELDIATALAENDIKVRFARKSHEVAAAELKRSLESVERFPKSISQTELDRLKLLADKAELEVEQAMIDQQQAKLSRQLKAHDVERASLILERHSLRAPFPGVLVQWKKERGEWVEPGMPVVRLIRLNRLRAEAFLASTHPPAELVGRPVTFRIGSGASQSEYEGKLVFVDPEIDPVNNQVRIVAEIVNPDLVLQPGQSGTLLLRSRRE